MIDQFDYLMQTEEVCSKLYKHLIHLDQVDSTNKFALNLSEKEHGVCIYSKNQFEGKGREGRFWHGKQNKSLALSILLEYPKTDRHKSLLPILTANIFMVHKEKSFLILSSQRVEYQTTYSFSIPLLLHQILCVAALAQYGR